MAMCTVLALLSSVCMVVAQPAAPYITSGGRVLLNNTAVPFSSLSTARNNNTNSLVCHTDLNTTCCREGSTHGGRWVAVDGEDSIQQTLGEGVVVLNGVSSTGNIFCEIDTAASIARGGPRDVLYITILHPSSVFVR